MIYAYIYIYIYIYITQYICPDYETEPVPETLELYTIQTRLNALKDFITFSHNFTKIYTSGGCAIAQALRR
jgi:hypothetical protein